MNICLIITALLVWLSVPACIEPRVSEVAARRVKIACRWLAAAIMVLAIICR